MDQRLARISWPLGCSSPPKLSRGGTLKTKLYFDYFCLFSRRRSLCFMTRWPWRRERNSRAKEKKKKRRRRRARGSSAGLKEGSEGEKYLLCLHVQYIYRQIGLAIFSCHPRRVELVYLPVAYFFRLRILAKKSAHAFGSYLFIIICHISISFFFKKNAFLCHRFLGDLRDDLDASYFFEQRLKSEMQKL